jgi:4-hydroxy-tetrahydrodipicolinate synthase
MSRQPFDGVLAPVLTPFHEDLSVDRDRWIAFCKRLLARGCRGLVPFGTTSEAASLSLAEKLDLLAALRAAEVPGTMLMPGTGVASLPETVRLTRAAVEHGCAGVLLLPPFYYKKVSDDGLYAYAAEVIRQVGDARLKIYLYHIPPVAGVGWSPELVERLARAFPDTVVGLKDSGGDWSYTETVLRRLPGFGAFVGNERFMSDAVELGGPGTITATANVNPELIARAFDRCGRSGGTDLNDAMLAYRRAVEQYPTIPGLKAVLARRSRHPGWARVRPPLTPLPDDQAAELDDKLAALETLAAPPGERI